MNNFDLLKNIGEIDPIYLDTTYKRKTKYIAKLCIAAAVFIICLFIPFFLHYIMPTKSSNTKRSIYYLEANANEVEVVEYEDDRIELHLQSSPISNPEIFFIGHHIFELFIYPEYDFSTHNNMTPSFSYNGKYYKQLSDNIYLGHVMVTDASDAPPKQAFVIAGWFDTSTDVTVTLSDGETGELLKNFILYVKYDPVEDTYDLRVTDLLTE